MSESSTQPKNEDSPSIPEGTQGPVSGVDTASAPSAETVLKDQRSSQPEEQVPGVSASFDESQENSPDDVPAVDAASAPLAEISTPDGGISSRSDEPASVSPAPLDEGGANAELDPESATQGDAAASDSVNIVFAGSGSGSNEVAGEAAPQDESQPSESDEPTSVSPAPLDEGGANAELDPESATQGDAAASDSVNIVFAGSGSGSNEVAGEVSAEAAPQDERRHQLQPAEDASASVAPSEESTEDSTACAASKVDADSTSSDGSGTESSSLSDEHASISSDPLNEGMEDAALDPATDTEKVADAPSKDSAEDLANVVSEVEEASTLSDDTESAEPENEDSDASATSDVQDTLGLSDELEEKLFDPETEDKGLLKGRDHGMGGDQDYAEYHIVSLLPRGYYRALRAREHPVILTAQPLDPLWVENDHPLQHPRLPSILYAGEDGVVLDEVKGDPVPRGLPLHEAVSLLHGVALLLRFLSVKGLAVTDIDLSGLVRTADGVRLQYLPTLARMGQTAQVTFGDGTPLEGSMTESATEATSMFLWGAMLFALVTGENLPAEGLDRQTLSQVKIPGLPQLLNAAMSDRSACPDLRTLREIYQAFQRPPSPQYQIGAASTIGLNPARLCNEDSYGLDHHAWEYHDQHWQCLRACVADGMGGEAAGEIASQAAVNTFCQHPAPARLERPDVQVQWTRELGWEANQAVRKAVGDAGGGCTLTGIVVVNDRLALAHVGDSRAYLHSAQKGLELLSRDHSLVRALLDSGNMSEDEAATSSLINQVTRALGQAMPEDYVDTLAHLVDAKGQPLREAHLTLETGDRVLLMSDGIWGAWEYRDSVITEELTKIIDAADAAGPDPQALADALIQCALDAGADDNATIVVVARVA